MAGGGGQGSEGGQILLLQEVAKTPKQVSIMDDGLGES